MSLTLGRFAALAMLGASLISLATVSHAGPPAGELATVREVGTWQKAASHTYVITHGLGGRQDGDRFSYLAEAIQQRHPRCNVVLIDWTETASLTQFGLPAPWRVARYIDDVANDAHQRLQAKPFLAKQTTLIGESFGNYVNYELAKLLGGVQHILALNPANEMGGYPTPDLRKVAKQSWSFHTHSPYDTCNPLAHSELFLETPPGATASEQHTFGIAWLTQQLRQGNSSWLRLQGELPARKPDAYCAKVTLAGQIEDIAVPRVPPTPTKSAPQAVDPSLLADQAP